MAPSADISKTLAVSQPSHDAAPDIAGKGVANPVATILSTALLLDWLAEHNNDARCAMAATSVREATASVLASGPRTDGLGGNAGTDAVTSAIIAALPAKN